MGANARTETPLPVRGTPGGWKDPWDDDDDAAVLRERVRLAEARVEVRAREIAQQLRQEPEQASSGTSHD